MIPTFNAQFLRAEHFLCSFAYITGWRIRFAVCHFPGEESMDAFKDAQREPRPLLWGRGEKEASSTGSEPVWLSVSQSCATPVTKHETGLNFPGFRFHITLWASARYLQPGLRNFGG